MNKHAKFEEKDSYVDLFYYERMRRGFCIELLMDNSQHSPEHVWPSPENPSLHLQL